MKDPFDAESFFARVQAGEFNGRLTEVLQTLSFEDLQRVARIALEYAEQPKKEQD